MLACSSQPDRRVEAENQAGVEAVSVLTVSGPRYDPKGTQGNGPNLRAQCEAWSFDSGKAEAFFRLSQRISPEAAHHDFNRLPCSVGGQLKAEGKTWDFVVNAAATAIWTSGDEVRNFGCSAPACEPLVLMMPDGPEVPDG